MNIMDGISIRRNAIITAGVFVIFVIITISIMISTFGNKIVEPVSPEASMYLKEVNMGVVGEKIQIMLENNYGLSRDKQGDVKAIIRENTFEYETDNNKLLWANFLIDLNNPRLTYFVSYDFDIEEASLSCPSIELMQDPDVFCLGDDDSTISTVLSKYLPYDGVTENGVDFTIWEDFDDDGETRLNMYANICDNEEIGQEVERTIKDWVKSKGVPNPDIIPLNLHYSYCDSYIVE